MRKGFSPGDPVVVVNNKLATFGQAGEVVKVATTAGVCRIYVNHDGVQEEGIYYGPHSLMRGTELPFPQRPFEMVILKKIEQRVPQALYSSQADEEIRLLVQVLWDSLIPGWRMELVVKRLNEMANKFSPNGDERRTHFYLKHLADEMKNGFKWHGDSA